MTLLGVSLQIHKWIALVVGVQVLFWTAGGVVMTVIPIERVRSEHHLAKALPRRSTSRARSPPNRPRPAPASQAPPRRC